MCLRENHSLSSEHTRCHPGTRRQTPRKLVRAYFSITCWYIWNRRASATLSPLRTNGKYFAHFSAPGMEITCHVRLQPNHNSLEQQGILQIPPRWFGWRGAQVRKEEMVFLIFPFLPPSLVCREWHFGSDLRPLRTQPHPIKTCMGRSFSHILDRARHA